MEDQKKGIVPFFPHHALTEMALAMFYLGLVFIFAGVHHAELGPPSNPVQTPAHIKPEWYFLWMFGLLKIANKLVGLIIPGLVFAAIFLLPWLDRTKDHRPQKRPKVMIATVVTLVCMVILTYIGVRPQG